MATTSGANTESAGSVLGSTAVYEDKKVEVTLAVFLSAANARKVGLDGKEFKPGDKVKVQRDDAAALIGQGAVQVDPTDHAAVAKILGIKTK